MTDEHERHRALFRTRVLRQRVTKAESELILAHKAFVQRRNVATMAAREAAERRVNHARRQLDEAVSELETEKG